MQRKWIRSEWKSFEEFQDPHDGRMTSDSSGAIRRPAASTLCNKTNPSFASCWRQDSIAMVHPTKNVHRATPEGFILCGSRAPTKSQAPTRTCTHSSESTSAPLAWNGIPDEDVIQRPSLWNILFLADWWLHFRPLASCKLQLKNDQK